MIRRTGALAVAAAVAALAATGAPPAAFGAAAVSLHGTVMAAGKPLGGAQVTLFAGSRAGVSELGHARTDTSGSFGISYVKPAAGVLYVQAAPAGASRLRLQSVVAVGSGGGVPPHTLTTVTVDELTTVATAYALAQFSGPNGIAGPSPGLEDADRRHRNRGDRRRGHAGMHPADTRARSALHGDRHRLPAADRDARGGWHACFFCCCPDRRRGQRQPAGRDAGLGVGRDHRRVCRARDRRCAVLPDRASAARRQA